MDFRLTPEQLRFQEEVRAFLGENLPAGWGEGPPEEESSEEYWQLSRRFMRKLGERGWLGLGWPRQYGGLARPFMEVFILQEELARWAAPTDHYRIGSGIVAPALMLFGSEEQKGFFLPRLIRGEVWFCLGYSEPGVGSDLASLQTRAVPQGDHFLINGQKIWTTNAHRADYCWLAARTDPEAPKHRGISLFIVDMRTPGITIKPIINMLGIHSFNQVFFDNVRVPRTALVGEQNRGWYHLAAALDFERSASFIPVAPIRRALDDILSLARGMRVGLRHPALPSTHRHLLAQLAVETAVYEVLAYRTAWMIDRGLIPNHEASASKLFATELIQRLANAAVNLAGLYGTLGEGSRWAPLMGRLARLYLGSVAATIGGGTSEIQRSVIAVRGLGLPHG